MPQASYGGPHKQSMNILAAVRRDLVARVYLAENADEALAGRFLACAEASIASLSEHAESSRAAQPSAWTMKSPEAWSNFPQIVQTADSGAHLPLLSPVVHRLIPWECE